MKAPIALASAVLLGAMQAPASRTVASDPDLIRGIDQLNAGDFDSSVISLQAAIQRLGREPSRIKEQALAFVYLGVAYVELDQEAVAREKFDQALRLDPGFRMEPQDFSAQQIRIFDVVLGERVAAARAVASPRPKGGGAGRILAIVGGAAAVAGIAVAAGASGSSTPISTATTTTTTTLSPLCDSLPFPGWISPADRATVSGPVSLICSTPLGLNCPGLSLDFQRCNGNCLGMSAVPFIFIAVGANPPNYSASWDTTTVPNGAQTLACFLRIGGGSGRGTLRLVEVRN